MVRLTMNEAKRLKELVAYPRKSGRNQRGGLLRTKREQTMKKS